MIGELERKATDYGATQNRIEANILQIESSLGYYRHEINRIEGLSTEEVKRLALSITHGLRKKKNPWDIVPEEPIKSRQARAKVIEANLRLAMYWAMKYKNLGIDVLDLAQEGNLGLMHAVEKFDPLKGVKFSTYASNWIRQYILTALAEQVSIIRVPLYIVDEMKRLERKRRQFQQIAETGGEPAPEYLACEMETSIQRVHQLLRLRATNQEILSLDAPHAGSDDAVPLSDLVEDGAPLPDVVVVDNELHDRLEECLKKLLLRERRVLQLRYGLNGGKEHSLNEAARIIGISHEAVRQTEFRALRKLSSIDPILREFCEI